MDQSFKYVTGFVLSGLIAALAHPALAQTTPSGLEGAMNFREVGGYRTSDGLKMRHGLIYRSGQLSDLTPADQAKLARLGIGYEIDLRGPGERTAKPTHWGPEAPKLFIVPPGKGPAPEHKYTDTPPDMGYAKAMVRDMFTAFVLNRAEGNGELLREVAKADRPALIHCTAGKDRTGVAIALLMTILGVPHDQVVHEYLLSSNRGPIVSPPSAKAASPAPKPSSPPDPRTAAMLEAVSVAPQNIEAAFTAINQKYKSFDIYIRDGLKLSPAEVDRLRARLLEK